MPPDTPLTRSPGFPPVDRGFWTGGQYSLCRGLTGLGLCAAALALAIRETVPGARVPIIGVTPAALVAALAALVWAVGLGDRIAAVVLLATGAGIVVAGPFPTASAAVVLAAILVAHLLIPRAPYGSLAARGRVDPAGGWRMPRIVWHGLWIVLAAAYAERSIARLGRPEWTDGSALARALAGDAARFVQVRQHLSALPPALLQAVTWGVLAAGIAFLPALFVPHLRAWAWMALGTVQVARLALLHTAGDAEALLAAHLFTFDPGWVPGARGAASPVEARRTLGRGGAPGRRRPGAARRRRLRPRGGSAASPFRPTARGLPAHARPPALALRPRLGPARRARSARAIARPSLQGSRRDAAPSPAPRRSGARCSGG
jgi:hypothetical protein